MIRASEPFNPPPKWPASLWAGSLAWLEHPADNREVAGSNPASPTNPKTRHGIVSLNLKTFRRFAKEMKRTRVGQDEE